MINTWWESLSARERLMLIVILLVVLILGCYTIIWEPIRRQVLNLRQTVAAERIQVSWMEQAAAEIATLRGINKPKTTSNNNESLLAIVDRGTRSAGMGANINRVEPEGKDKVRVWLNEVLFDNLIRWLAGLNANQGIVTESLVVERQGIAGQVNVRLVLTEIKN